MTRFIFYTCFALCVLTLDAQERNKPQISSIAALPADVPLSPATCATSRSGYLENKTKRNVEADLTKVVTSSLREGYVLTIYEHCLTISKFSGARYLVADVKPSAVTWYERYDFRTIDGTSNPDSMKMFIDLKAVAAAIDHKAMAAAQVQH